MAASLTVLTVSPQRVHLQLLNPDGRDVGKVMRSDRNGTRTVRTLINQLPSTAASFDLYDYEYSPAWDQTVTWSAYDTVNNHLVTVTYTFTGPNVWHVLAFAVPLYPSNGITLSPADAPGTPISFGLDWTSARNSLTTLHRVTGRSDPVPVLRPAGTREGSMTLICPDHATCKLIESQLSLPYVYMLRQSDVTGLDLYFTVGSLSASNIGGTKRWQLVVAFTEVAWPPGSFVPPSVWTYAELLASQYGDYNAVAASFQSYAYLLDNIAIP